MENNKTKNNNILKRSILPGISLITAVKNREENLRQTLPTWLACPEIDEIVIVDWSSDNSLEPLVNEFQDGRILLAVVKDQPKWILSFACNLAARLASKDKLLKIDADVKVHPGFFARHQLKEGIFFSGNWEIARNDNERHLNGIFFCYRNDFVRINGYNEFIKSYGWDDSDLYIRLSKAGLLRNDFDLDSVQHMEHAKRTSFQDHTSFIRSIDDDERAVLNIMINYNICKILDPWSLKNKQLSFSLEQKNKYVVVCMQAGEDKNIVPREVMEECEKKAIRQRLTHLKENLSPEIEDNLSKDELQEFYNLLFSKNYSSSDGSLYLLIRKMADELQSLNKKSPT